MTPRVYVAQTTTGVILDEIGGATGNLTDDLRGANISCQISVPVRPGTRALLTPWRHSLVVMDDARCWWAGPITAAPTRQRGDMASVAAGSMWSILAQRPAWIAGQYPPSEAADLAVIRRSWRGLAVAALDCGLSYGALPIALDRRDLDGTLDRLWPSYALTNTADALRDLKVGDADSDTVEVHFAPRKVDQVDNRIEWVARIGNPTLSGREHVWDSGSDAMRDLTESAGDGRLSTHAWVGGAGQELARVVGSASAPGKIGQGWPALHRIDASGASQVEDPRDARQMAEAAVRRDEGMTLQPVVDPDGAPDKSGARTAPAFGEWVLGDTARLDVNGDPWTPDGTYTGRISSWSYSLGKREVALGLSGDMQTIAPR